MDPETVKTRVILIPDNRTKLLVNNFGKLLAEDAAPEQLESLYASFLNDLQQLEIFLTKEKRDEMVAARDIQTYQFEASLIEQGQMETEAKIATLWQKLERAQRDRSRAIEYDAVAADINRFPTQENAVEYLRKLNVEISELRVEEETYAQTWKARADAFDAIVSELKLMNEAIKDEKNEQERKRQLNQADDGDNQGEDGEIEMVEEAASAPSQLNPEAPPFEPKRDVEMTEGEAEEGEMLVED